MFTRETGRGCLNCFGGLRLCPQLRLLLGGCVGYEVRTNWVGLSRHHILVSGLNHCVPLLSLFISI